MDSFVAKRDSARLSESGIYQIRNLVNGRCYVGQSLNIQHRFSQHKVARKRSGHLSISRAIRKYGIDNFAFEVIELCSVDKLFDRERFWISVLKPEYNRSPGGEGNPRPCSDQTKERLRVCGKLQWLRRTENQRRTFIATNLKGPRKGHFVSAASRMRMSESHRGKSNPSRWQAVVRGLSWHHGITAAFPSVTSAVKETRINQSLISMAIHGRNKTAGGFIWKLAA